MEINRHAISALLAAFSKDVRRAGISNDYATFYDDLSKEIEHAEKLVRTRGQHEYVLIDNPDLGKIFDKGLSSGSLHWKAIYSIRDTKGGRERIASIFSHIFVENGPGLTGGKEIADLVYFVRQYLYLFKKASIQCPQSSIEDAVDDFISIDQGLRVPDGTWDRDTWIPQSFKFSREFDLVRSHPRGERLWEIVDRVFESTIPSNPIDRLSIKPKHGPGAVADLKTGGDKFSFPHWPSKLDGQFPWSWFVQHREDLHVTDALTSKLSPKEPPARLIAVPKTFKGPRLIASEPIAHQFLQQGLMQWFRNTLSPLLRTSIDFLSQEPSRQLALSASQRGDLATVDLSSASDRLSCWTVERALSSNQDLLAMLHAVRTRAIVDGTGTDELLSLKMKKFAAQGSAVTFPVQTIIYAVLAISAVLFHEKLEPSKRNIRKVGRKVRVFGDDIICPRNCVPVLSLMLQALELKVNVSKTHYQGGFRESCGMDAFLGFDVTPAYIGHLEWDKSPEKFSSWVEVSNNFFRKGLWNTAEFMDSQIDPSYRKKMLITNQQGDGYRLFTFSRGFSTQAQVRFSPNLHRTECQVLALRARVRKKKRGSWHDLYDYFIQSPNPQSKWTAGYVTKNTFTLKKVWAPVEVA